MSDKNKIYLFGVISYLLAGIGGFLINTDFYWIILLASAIISTIVLTLVLNKDKKEELFKPLMFDWISILAFTGLELLLVILIDLAKLPFAGFVGVFNITVQILGYVFVGYSIVRFTLEHTSFYRNGKFSFLNPSKKEEKIEKTYPEEEEEVTQGVEIKKLEEKKEEPQQEPQTDIDDVPVVGQEQTPVEEEKVKEIELKKEEEKEVKTPYMEEER